MRGVLDSRNRELRCGAALVRACSATCVSGMAEKNHDTEWLNRGPLFPTKTPHFHHTFSLPCRTATVAPDRSLLYPWCENGYKMATGI